MADDHGQSREIATDTNAGLRALAGGVQINRNGLAPTNLAELMDFAQLMAKAGPMVGKAFRGQPGACLAISMQAMSWGMNPFAVSQKAYTTGDGDKAQIGYEAQLVTAVINAHAPVKERPKFSFEGEGQKRRCTVTATLKGETEACIYVSPEVGTITTKNSPLWKQDPDQQLAYYSVRAWARRFCPEVIMGVYAIDELDSATPMHVVQVDELDQRRPEEIAESRTGGRTFVDEGDGAAFIGGEAWTLVCAHYTTLFEQTVTLEALDAQWKSFQRKYWIGKRRCISHNSFDGVEHLYAQHRERVILLELNAITSLDALEQWFVGNEAALHDHEREIYEAMHDELSAEMVAELDRKRRENGDIVADAAQ